MTRQNKIIGNHPIKAIIFDLDGTLLDSIECEANLAKRFFYEQLGISINDEMMRTFTGLNTNEILHSIAPPEHIEELFDNWIEIINETGDTIELFPGIREMVEDLSGRGIKLAVATSKVRLELDANPKTLLIERMILVWLTADDVANPKPHPDQVIKACELLGVHPTKALMIGDSKFDMLAGKNAGVKTGLLFGVCLIRSSSWVIPQTTLSNLLGMLSICLPKIE